MTTTEVKRLGKRLMIPLCPERYATACILNAATQFFKDAEVWRHTVEKINVVADQARYVLALEDPGIDVYRILWVKWLGGLISDSQYYLDYLNVAAEGEDEDWQYCLVFRENYIPSGSIEECLDVEVVLAPSLQDGYVRVGEWRLWTGAILAGARVLAFSSNHHPWYTQEGAAKAEHDYSVELAKASRERTQQFSSDGELRVTNPEGWL